MGKIIAVVSGKGGTGKTTFTSCIGFALASMGKKVLCLDCDISLRNLDLALGLSDSALMDFSDVLSGRCTLEQAVVSHPKYPSLFLLAAPLAYDGFRVEPEQAAALKDMGRVDVRLAKGFDQSIRMSVVSVSREENGQAAVVLSSTRYLAQTTLLRHQAADAVLHTYQGLRVPADALRVSADGTTGVYCVDGENASFRPIELVYQGEGYALVKPAEGVRDTQTLRSGDQVIATSGELYDGKVIR